ncbi:hypothetical protein [Zhongshania borealis]|uniref:Uncharacterized protein n=1 Tax=Zhongshania borealis TaxID=889488 RepID=A0ABP7X9A8_9GAMM
MTVRKLVSVGVALVAMSLAAEAKVSGGWELEAISKSTGYSVHGQEGSKNQFGLLKHSNTCAADELYISWVSDSDNIWPLAGKQISLAADFDGVALDIPVEVVSIRPMQGDRYQVIFGRSFANSELLSLMANAASVNLVMASTDVAQFFSVTGDRFSMQGFAQARLDAQSRCQSQSS